MSDADIQKIKEKSANCYVALVVKYLSMSNKSFSPAITKIAMEIEAEARDNGSVDHIWKLYLELIEVSKTEGMDLSILPLIAFGTTIY